MKMNPLTIPKLTNHRLTNPTDGNLEIIEIQLGTYLGEDDIVRLKITMAARRKQLNDSPISTPAVPFFFQ